MWNATGEFSIEEDKIIKGWVVRDKRGITRFILQEGYCITMEDYQLLLTFPKDVLDKIPFKIIVENRV